MTTPQVPKIRGCGERSQNSLYATVPMSPNGMPLAFFLVDIPREWDGGQLRAPMIVPSEKEEGVNHIMLGVGKTSYPTIADFVEEGNIMGLSKRLPRNFEVERLTPNMSKMLLVHPRAIPKFKYTIDFDRKQNCPNVRYKREPMHIGKDVFCIDDLWSLGYFMEVDEKHVINEKNLKDTVVAEVITPSARYMIRKPAVPAKTNVAYIRKHHEKHFKYKAGVFAILPLQFEWVNRQGKVPTDLASRFAKAGWNVEIKEF